jgi:hypothetical protein
MSSGFLVLLELFLKRPASLVRLEEEPCIDHSGGGVRTLSTSEFKPPGYLWIAGTLPTLVRESELLVYLDPIGSPCDFSFISKSVHSESDSLYIHIPYGHSHSLLTANIHWQQ